MSAAARALAARALAARPERSARLVRAGLVTLGLLVVVGGRWAATVAEAPPLAVGALFGFALVAIAWTGGLRPAGTHPWAIRPTVVLIGLAGAVALVGLAVGASRLAGLPLRVVPQTDFGWWALITIVVATAEELILRGVLFDALRDAAGGRGRADDPTALAVAVIATSLLFALIHVPLYGWHVVPLDLGVGVFLAGLRLVSGSVAAPAIAHVVADLATWWI
ncbi:MAG: CPBP family intramembrane glutamic endopeptidase [Candidatus Limnocylindrales bacterium]